MMQNEDEEREELVWFGRWKEALFLVSERVDIFLHFILVQLKGITLQMDILNDMFPMKFQPVSISYWCFWNYIYIMCVVHSTNLGARPYHDHYGFCFILCFHFDFSIINEHEMDTGLFVQCLVTHSSVHCTLYALAVRLMGGQIEWNWRFCLPTTLVTFDTLLFSTIIRKNVLNNMLLARHPLKFTCHTKYACTQRVCSALSHCVNTYEYVKFTDSRITNDR